MLVRNIVLITALIERNQQTSENKIDTSKHTYENIKSIIIIIISNESNKQNNYNIVYPNKEIIN